MRNTDDVGLLPAVTFNDDPALMAVEGNGCGVVADICREARYTLSLRRWLKLKALLAQVLIILIGTNRITEQRESLILYIL